MSFSLQILFFLMVLVTITEASAGNRVYVSSSTGNDLNSGLTQQRPVKSILKALVLGDTLFLKAGDSFYEGNLTVSKGLLTRYGNGPNPTICGYKRIVEPRWTEVENNIWRLNLVEDNFVGILFNGPSKSNNICAFHDYEKDSIHGRKVMHREEMASDWDFWQTEVLSQASPEDYNFIYLYLTSNPNHIKMEMSVYDCALKVNHAVIESINFVGFGFGISAHTQTVIRNCKIDAIGGRIIPERNSYICYGNGIEFYVVSSDIESCIVEGCFISRCYDCGITIQGTGGTTATPRNIIIRDNLITSCCQGWEDFLRNNKDVKYENCSFSNNIVIHSGNTSGFGYNKSRFKYCHVLGNNFTGNKGMIIKNNVFADGNFYCSGVYNEQYRSNIWFNNKCYIKKGDYLLSEYSGRRDVLRVGKNRFVSSKKIKLYRNLTGDYSTTFHIRSEKRVISKAHQLELVFLKNHSY